MLLEKIKNRKDTISFDVVMEYIDRNYQFTPTAFKNGNIKNESNENNGSCKIFSFGKMHDLTKEETLHLFGEYYRKDVLENPNGTDHQNIRNFIEYGWERIIFKENALEVI